MLFFALANALFAQDFSAQNSKYSPSIYGDKFTYEEDKFYYFNELSGVLFLKGKIEKGMYKDFRQAITDNNIQTLVLDSPGGSVSEGLRIAGTVFDRKIKTYIRKNQNCASACSFIFLSGKTRYTLGKLGVHQIAFDEEFSKKKEEIGLIGEVIQLTNSDIVQYLDENNTPGFVYKYMLRTPSDEMYYFNEDELNQLGNSDISNQDKLHFNRIDNFTKDYNSHLIENKCDTDPNSCNVAQLCTRAAKDGAWRTSLDAVKFVRLAKSKGKRCGVPVPQCPENIKKCNKDYLCTYGTTGTDASLSWLNNPFANEAKRRGLSCGVSEKLVYKDNCSQDVRNCTNTKLCSLATNMDIINNKAQKFWEKNTGLNKYVVEAKRRGLSCGVKKQVLKKTCSQDASSCNNSFLCQKATTTISGQKSWDNRTSWASYVTEAKRRGLSCGVTPSAPAILNKTCDTDPKKCSSSRLCIIATNGNKWETISDFKKYVEEAKNRGLSCGVKKQVINRTCYKDTKICNSKQLCKLSVQFGSNPKKWTTNQRYKKYIIEAKKRGLSCGVQKKKPIINEMVRSIQKQLNRLGCNAGTADGILGNKTRSALMRWKSVGGNYIPNNINQTLRSELFESRSKCSSNNLTLAGTWDVIYSLCSNQRYKATLKLSKLTQKEFYATYNAVHGYYSGKAKIQNGIFKISLSGVNGKLTASGFVNKYFNRAQGKDQNGCLFEGNKR